MFKNNEKITFSTVLSVFLFFIANYLSAELIKNVQMNLNNSNGKDFKENLILKKINVIEQQISEAKNIVTNKNKIKELDKIYQELKNLKIEQTKEQSSTAMFILGPLEAIYSVAKERDIKYKLLQISNKLGGVLEPKNITEKKGEPYKSLNKSIKNNEKLLSHMHKD